MFFFFYLIYFTSQEPVVANDRLEVKEKMEVKDWNFALSL